MYRLSLTLLTTVLFTVSANAAPVFSSKAAFIEKTQRATLCEKSYEMSSSLISYSARTQNVFRAAQTKNLADDLERKQHIIEKKTDGSVAEAVRLGFSVAEYKSLVYRDRQQAEIYTAAAYQQVDESKYQIIARQVDKDCLAFTR
jgi:hypothetical protein